MDGAEVSLGELIMVKKLVFVHTVQYVIAFFYVAYLFCFIVFLCVLFIIILFLSILYVGGVDLSSLRDDRSSVDFTDIYDHRKTATTAALPDKSCCTVS